MSRPTHDLLVRKAARWLLRSMRCTFVMLEPHNPAAGEQPDVLGFRLGGWSILVECKASRSDFLRDRDKPCRRVCRPCTNMRGEPVDCWNLGIGQERWYCVAEGVIRSPLDVPEHWGAVELTSRGSLRRLTDARSQPHVDLDPEILRREFSILLSGLRRAHVGYGELPWLKFHPDQPRASA